MAEEEVIIIDDETDDDDCWMDPAVAEEIEMERERREKWRKLYAKEESSDRVPDFDFRSSDVEELLQYEREQLSKRNHETSVIQFIRHQELGLKKPRTNSLKRFLQSRNVCAQLGKCDASFCIYEEEPNHTTLKCFGNRLYENLELRKETDKFEENVHENMLRHDLETLKSLREYMNGRREDKQICESKPALKYTVAVLCEEENGKYYWRGPSLPGAPSPN